MNDLEKAKELLAAGDYTCVLCKDDIVYTSKERGVKPLLALLDSETDCSGFSAADKIVGNGAAYLYVLLGVAEVYAPTMSETAVKTLARNLICIDCGKVVDYIVNRSGDGICPMEEATLDADSPEDALNKIKERLAQLTVSK